MTIKIQKHLNTNSSEISFSKALSLILLVLFFVPTTDAQFNFNGVLQNYLAVQTTDESEFLASRNRLRLGLEKSTGFGGLNSELDIIHNYNKSQNIELLLKEAYIDWYLQKYDLRIGHQKIIWGRSNGTFITDIVTPVDLREFLTISAEDIRFGITSFNAIRYFGANSIQFIAAPFFQPDLLPSAESRWFPAPQIKSVFSPVTVTTTPEDQNYSLEDAQLAIRYSWLSPENLDLDMFLMRWTHPTPAYSISLNFSDVPSVELIESYQNTWMTGFSSSLKLRSNLFLLTETLFVRNKLLNLNPLDQFQLDNPVDLNSFLQLLQTLQPDENRFLIEKPWLHSMTGFRTEIFKTTIDAQFFLEAIFDYDEQILQEKIYRYATLLATRSFLRDRLQLLTLSRYNIDTEDFWIQFQGQYELGDNLQLTLGTNLFGGKKNQDFSGHLSFSQFRENSFVFSKIVLFF